MVEFSNFFMIIVEMPICKHVANTFADLEARYYCPANYENNF